MAQKTFNIYIHKSCDPSSPYDLRESFKNDYKAN